MQEYGARRLASRTLDEIVIAGEPCILWNGKAHASVIALPFKAWSDRIACVYGDRPPIACVDRMGLTEEVVVNILTNQVDADWQPCAYGLLTTGSGTGALYLVPANAHWLGEVRDG
jgi:hypothetical protein